MMKELRSQMDRKPIHGLEDSLFLGKQTGGGMIYQKHS
jgi:hypothetical protein